MSKYSINKLPSDILRSTAEHVSGLRKEKQWTQQELSVRSGVSYGSIKRFERLGKISFESLLKIAEAFGRLDEFSSLLRPKGLKKIEDLFNAKE